MYPWVDGFQLQVNGDLWVSGVSYPSDRRLKSNINVLENSIEKLLLLKTYSYTYDFQYYRDKFSLSKEEAYSDDKAKSITEKRIDAENGEIRYGFIAQELIELFPELVAIDEDTGIMSIDYIELIPFLVQAIQLQQAEINLLKSKME